MSETNDSAEVFEKPAAEDRQREITKDQAKGTTETIRIYNYKALDDMGIDKQETILEDYPNAKVVKKMSGGRVIDVEIKKSDLKKVRDQRHIDTYGYKPGQEPVYNKQGDVEVRSTSQAKVSGRQIHKHAEAVEAAQKAKATVQNE